MNCPGLIRFYQVLTWLYAIIRDQVKPGCDWYTGCPSLWPGWDWGHRNAFESHLNRPWRWTLYGYDEDEF